MIKDPKTKRTTLYDIDKIENIFIIAQGRVTAVIYSEGTRMLR